MSRVVVVGAGVGGLAVAARLAALGHRVTLVERAPAVGGKLGRVERRTAAGRFRFDTGPGLLTLPPVFADLFAATGSTVERELDLVPLDPIARHRFADGTVLDSCADPAEFAQRIAVALGPDAAAQWRRLWPRAQRSWDVSWRHVLQAPVSPLRLAALARRLGDLAAIAPSRTLRGLARRYLPDPRLRQLLERYATYTGSDPRRAPAALAAVAYAELAFGGWYLRGGLATLADALLRRCTDLGVTVLTSAEVVRVSTEAGRVTGVRLHDGETLPADIVVSDVDALTLHRDLLGTRVPRRMRERSLAGFVLLLGVSGRTPDLAHHTVVFSGDYDAEFDAIFGRPARPVPHPTALVTVADDPAVHPDGHEAWFVLVNAPPHGATRSTVDWRRPGRAERYADHVLATLAARGLDPRPRILFREVLTPADLEATTGAPGGAIYGSPRHGLAGLLRPANRLSRVPGLFLVGGSAHPGGGLPLVALSAQIVADQIGPCSTRAGIK